MKRSALLLVALVPLAPASALADECIGSVVLGRCYGTALPDYTNPRARPDDAWPNGQGFHASPRPGAQMEGCELHNYSRPVFIPGLGLRWVDPDESARRRQD